MNIEQLHMKGIDFCEQILEEYGLTITPGNNFGKEWEYYVRLSYAASMEDVVYAMDSIKKFVEARLK